MRIAHFSDLHILALEVSPQGIKCPLGRWDIPLDKVQKSWRQGLLGNSQMALESRLIRASGALAATQFPIRRPVSNIPFLEVVRRTK